MKYGIIKTTLEADIVDTHIHMDISMAAYEQKLKVTIFNVDFPIDKKHVKFHGTVTKVIADLIFTFLNNYIKK